MPTTRFNTTIEALKGGAENFEVDKAVKNIEGWEEYLSKHDADGVNKVTKSLGKLKKLLSAKEVDGEAIEKLLSTMGEETTSLAGEDDNATANLMRDLGEALSGGSKKTKKKS